MPTRHTLSTSACIDGENDLELVIVYNYTRGYPEQGPTYSCGGEPAQPPDCEVISVTVNGEPADDATTDWVQCNDRLWQKMVDNVEGE